MYTVFIAIICENSREMSFGPCQALGIAGWDPTFQIWKTFSLNVNCDAKKEDPAGFNHVVNFKMTDFEFPFRKCHD